MRCELFLAGQVEFIRDMGELFVEIFESLADDSHLSGNGHEIGIAFPSGHNVHVDMIWQAGAGTTIDIDTDIEPLGMNGLSKDILDITSEGHHFQHCIYF